MPRGRRRNPQAGQGGDIPAGSTTFGERQELEELQTVQRQAAGQTANPAERFEQAKTAAEAAPGPGKGMVAEPSRRPAEPVTAGLSTGPGPGPESLGPLPVADRHDPDIVYMAPLLPVLEQLSRRPGTSVATRNIVRRLRSMLPADFDFAQVLSGPTVAEATDMGAAGEMSAEPEAGR